VHRRLAGTVDERLARLALRAVLPAPSQHQGLWLEPKTRLPYLPGVGVEPADQAEEADRA
jgi:hypothetical protein